MFSCSCTPVIDVAGAPATFKLENRKYWCWNSSPHHHSRFHKGAAIFFYDQAFLLVGSTFNTSWH